MAVNYTYHYATIDPATKMCVSIQTTTAQISEEEIARTNKVELEVYDEEYLFKYYIDGNWYEDAAGTIPWTSSLLADE